MPRKARIDAPGALHHIVARGIDRRSIFEDDTDCKDFLNRVATILSDERILGDGDFVMTVLQQAGEQFERRYNLKAMGYDFEAVVKRVAKLLEIESNQVVTNSKNRQAVRARNLVCYWAFNELGMSQVDITPIKKMNDRIRRTCGRSTKTGYRLKNQQNPAAGGAGRRKRDQIK